MNKPNAQYVVSIETECLTAVPSKPSTVDLVIGRFLQELARLAPALTGNTGVFNTYARVYRDCGHIEMAMIECDSPYAAALIFERQQTLAARAVTGLAAAGIHLVLANNNHSGLLRDGCPVWGTHENYLSDRHPSTFSDQILPFLVTRIYGGSGGVHHPSGDFLACVRSTCLSRASGGGTTDGRAIHSLARDEHHMGNSPNRYRYHLLLGDGHRSQFNLALQLGATALAVKAVTHDPKLASQVALLRREFSGDWIGTLREINVLSQRGRPLRIHPLVVKTQRLYWEAAQRVAAATDDLPEWIPRLLGDWDRTLVAYEHLDRPWLARHLDAFAKYEFYSAVLADSGLDWSELPKHTQMFDELALLDQSYHEFCHPESVFAQLEQAGMMDHRVGPRIEPGAEAEPYIPEVATRAQARARFIRDHRNCPDYVIDWSCIQDKRQMRYVRLDDPFARDLGDWIPMPRPSESTGRSGLAETVLDALVRSYDRGRFEEMQTLLRHAEHLCDLHDVLLSGELLRHKALLQARRGFLDSERLLSHVYQEPPDTLVGVTDYCAVYRFCGLIPDLDAMQPWIARGRRLFRDGCGPGSAVEQTAVFREHAAAALTRHGRTEEALALLIPALSGPLRVRTSPRMQAQLLATLGETYRRMGRTAEARRVLHQALRIQTEGDYLGYLAYCTWPSLAKSEPQAADALDWLQRSKSVQERNRDDVGLLTTLLLEARLADSEPLAAEHHARVLILRDRLPAMQRCLLLSHILDHWDRWTAGRPRECDEQDFWGL